MNIITIIILGAIAGALIDIALRFARWEKRERQRELSRERFYDRARGVWWDSEYGREERDKISGGEPPPNH